MRDREYATCSICQERYDVDEGHNCLVKFPPSTVRLIKDLLESEAPLWIRKAAMNGLYNDYDSPLATPIIQLVRDALKAGLPSIAQNAKDGVYDGTKEESEKWFAKEGKELLTPNQAKALGFDTDL